MKRESWFYRLLKCLGLIKTYEVSKKEMCDNAKSICNRRCENCAWHELDDRDTAFRGVIFFDGGEEHIG